MGLPAKQFARRIENFACSHCGTQVVGDGYTNHCPKCLHSKHVDVNPGDRASKCFGEMEPVGLEQKRGTWVIVHRCVECGHTRKNHISPNDNMDALVALSVGV